MRYHLRPALSWLAILALAFVHGCASAPAQTGTETVSFVLHKSERASLARQCGQEDRRINAIACAQANAIFMPVRDGEAESVTRHEVTLHTYTSGPCPIACVVSGEVHVETEAWSGHLASVAGDAVIDATGVPVGYNDAWVLWHEIKHVRGHSHR